jgi:penicillin G amidase
MESKMLHKKTPKWRKNLVLSFLSVLLLLIVTAAIFARLKSRQGLPDYGKNLTLRNLEHPVEVFRDEYGTPHIYAQNDNDLYRAVGYVMAEDRLWQMDMLRRVTLGRLSEVLGEGYVKADLLMRSFQYTEKSNDILTGLSPEIVDGLEAFCDGVNQYIEDLGQELPLEFTLLGYAPEKWEPYHSLNLISFMAWQLKSGWGELVLEEIRQKVDSAHFASLLPDISLQQNYVFPSSDQIDLLTDNRLLESAKFLDLGLEVFSGSNNWAVSGKKSKTGFPILANDMHLELNIPGIWMQMHQCVPGKLNVSGVVLPGQPLVIVGHNDSIAWGMTNTMVDNLDYYEEKINPGNPDQYLFNGKWSDFEVVPVTIPCKKDTAYNFTYKFNHRGPVVSDIKNGKVLTIRWVGNEKSNEFLSIYKINRAGNWNDFKDAFSTFRAISQNIAYADVKGNIGLYTCAGVPIRKRDAIFRVLPGWTDEYDWKGLVPFEDLPHEYNPERGYVSSANNRTTDSTYPYHIGTWYSLPYRIKRIKELLEVNDKLSVDDFKEIQNDTKSKFSLQQVEKLFTLIDESRLNKLELEIALKLKCWDGNMDKELIEPTVAEVFNWIFVKQMFMDELEDKLFEKFEKNNKLARIAVYNLLEGKDMPWVDDVRTPENENLKDIVNRTFEETMVYMVDNYRADTRKWKWKYLHKLTLQHPIAKSVEALDFVFKLNRGPFAVSGSKHTVSPYSYPMFEPSRVYQGASHRHIFSLINWDSTQTVLPTGNSGIVSSEFYCDQTKLYVYGLYHTDYFSRQSVEQHQTYKMVMSPGQ